ncbi:MAG: hypothetical protein AABO57_17600 [Acidobacteriota bacterium]
MKIDRFVRVMLVLVALLLALNCATNFNNSSDSTVEAAPPPSFLQVGKTYTSGAMAFRVTEVSNTGWVTAEAQSPTTGRLTTMWINSNVLPYIEPR